MFARGAVWMAEMGGKRRPVVIVTNDALCDVLTRLTIVGVTTTRRGVRTEVELGSANGVKEGSVMNCLDLATVPTDILSRPLGELDVGQSRALDRALATALGIPS